ncbi:MAG TPA: ATP-binding protein [Oligoflexia bacterium]|nr:ATP-binding protein [Oligoflexia bacterium]HMP27125.1 ATP-binding protein [Oligoflexia bacterium]
MFFGLRRGSRKNNALLIWAIASLLIAAGAGWYIFREVDLGDTQDLGRQLTTFFVVNFLIAALSVLMALIGRQLIKLFFDRRNRILGSKLRLRLVVAFVSLAIIPTILTFALASGFLSRALNDWFSGQVEDVVEGAGAVAREHFEILKERYLANTLLAAKFLEDQKDDFDNLSVNLKQARLDSEAFALQLYSLSSRNLLGFSEHPTVGIEEFKLPDVRPEFFSAPRGASNIRYDEVGAAKYITIYSPLPKENDLLLVAFYRISPEMSFAISKINQAFEQYREIRLYKNPLKFSYIISLTLITGVIIFGAIWFGFYLAREITDPLAEIAQATMKVARGEYEHRLSSAGDDEIGELVKAFNFMLSNLRVSRAELEHKNILTETILKNLAVGVILLEPDNSILSMNQAARDLFSVSGDLDVRGKTLQQLFGFNFSEQLRPLLVKNEKKPLKSSELTIDLKSDNTLKRVVCTAGEIAGEDGSLEGRVLIFDDVTEISRAQKMEAWREVAKRVAHEIKNPLTPIKLSAQHLTAQASSGVSTKDLYDAGQTIIENVESIKRLVDQFAKLARMPLAEPSEFDFNQLVADLLSNYTESYQAVTFRAILDPNLPTVFLDREQITRVIVNLLDNAIQSVESGSVARTASSQISLRTHLLADSELFQFEIVDNGVGIPDELKSVIFEPHFTTKEKGSGLGLAVVSSIIFDHGGRIEVRDNPKESGARFIVELPLRLKTTSQRSFN